MKHNVVFYTSVHDAHALPRTDLPEIGISGRSNVGKSSLINRISQQRSLAKTSQTPGKTRMLNFFSVDDSFYLVDFPGYGYAQVSHTERERFRKLIQEYLDERAPLKGLIQLIDARHGPVTGDLAMIDWLAAWDHPVLFVFTKADKLSPNQQRALLKEYSERLGEDRMMLFSSLTGLGVDRLWSWILKTALDR